MSGVDPIGMRDGLAGELNRLCRSGSVFAQTAIAATANVPFLPEDD
jgi:hypothetical protein